MTDKVLNSKKQQKPPESNFKKLKKKSSYDGIS